VAQFGVQREPVVFTIIIPTHFILGIKCNRVVASIMHPPHT